MVDDMIDYEKLKNGYIAYLLEAYSLKNDSMDDNIGIGINTSSYTSEELDYLFELWKLL